jgi:hypothetical protein
MTACVSVFCVGLLLWQCLLFLNVFVFCDELHN